MSGVVRKGTLHLSPAGGWFCPVCGAEKEPELEWPYSLDAAYTGGSQNICRCCHTQYGHDDSETDTTDLDVVWARLRIKWLNRHQWPASLLCQLHDNLGLSEDALREQAKGISAD